MRALTLTCSGIEYMRREIAFLRRVWAFALAFPSIERLCFGARWPVGTDTAARVFVNNLRQYACWPVGTVTLTRLSVESLCLWAHRLMSTDTAARSFVENLMSCANWTIRARFVAAGNLQVSLEHLKCKFYTAIQVFNLTVTVAATSRSMFTVETFISGSLW